MVNLTQNQINKVQFNEGIVYANYGETSEKLIAPTRGGGEFVVTETIRDIEYDGMPGKTKGLQVVESIDATLKVTTLGVDQDTLILALSGATLANNVITNDEIGVVASAKYLTNVTMFCKLLDGTYKKITIYNAMHEGGLTLGAKPKGEAEIALEFNAHWNPLDFTDAIYQIEDVTNFPEVSA